jgi:hypothetical protein
VFEAMQRTVRGIVAIVFFPKNKTPDRCEAGVVIKALLWSKLAANASHKKKVA